jgi:inorganic pyrophosphatase
MVLADEELPVGCLLDVRVVGVIEGEQTEGGATGRNDRLLGVASASHLHEPVSRVEELNPRLVEQVSQFFVNYNALKGKEFKVLGVRGPERAIELIERGVAAYEERRSKEE